MSLVCPSCQKPMTVTRQDTDQDGSVEIDAVCDSPVEVCSISMVTIYAEAQS